MAAQNQKAFVLLKRFGDLAVTSLAVPKPSKGEVLVKVHSTALNPVDWKVQKWNVFITEESYFPVVLGMDLAGEVVELGEGVKKWKIGDRV
jgi:NADPH:quinone reductase-like Zn-dependent oxidoreductase